jgi:hypothetical protein
LSDTTIESTHGTAFFTRKVTPRQYESAEAGFYIPFDIPTDPNLSDEARGAAITQSANDAMFQAKALTFEALGIEFSVDEGGAIVELVKAVFPGTTVAGGIHPAPAAAPSAPAAAGDAAPPFPADTRDKDQKAANKAWGVARLASNPDEFYDNRPKKADGSYKSTAPDFKHKASGLGIWTS